MQENSIESRLLKKLEVLKTERSNWNTSWDIVAQYVDTKKQDFTSTGTDGEFLNNKLFSNLAGFYAKARASTLKSMVFGNYEFKLTPSYKFKDNSDLITFLDQATNVLKNEMKHYKANLDKTLEEAEDYDAVFGTSVIYCDFNKKIDQIQAGNEAEGIKPLIENNSHLFYKCIPLKECYIDEDYDGDVNQLFREFGLTVKQAVDKFGIDNFCDKVKKQYNDKRFEEKLTILNVIIPIDKYMIDLFEIKNNYKYISLFIDETNRTKIAAQGYFSKPFFVHRESKKTNEKYGRSVSMDAISNIILINKTTEDIMKLCNRSADEPIGIIGDNMNFIDISDGAINVFDPSIQNPVFPIFKNIDNPQTIVEFRETLKEELSKYYGIDKMLDFNNQTQMTAEEVRKRAEIRNQTMSYIFNSKIAERYNPLIERSFELLFLNHYFDDFINKKVEELMGTGEELYNIEYYNQIERDKNTKTVENILNVWNIGATIANYIQNLEVFDNIDYDETISVMKSTVDTNSIFRGKEKVKEIRMARLQQQYALQEQQIQGKQNV